MKPTTTSAFVSSVHLQKSQSRIIHGLSGRAAGAHTLSLPAVQNQQPKRVPYSAGGGLVNSQGCRFLILLMNLLVCNLLYANDDVIPSNNNTPKARKETQQIVQACHQPDSHLAPAMVAIRPGAFQMGSPDHDVDGRVDERPQHPVTIPQPFAISRCEITVGQFKRFVQENPAFQSTAESNGQGCRTWDVDSFSFKTQPEHNWENPGFTQNDTHPVVCVSWDDAQHYVRWLSKRTGAQYRLPTEAEWEYVARAGSTTAYWWGDEIGQNNAVCNDCGSQWDNRQTAPVGSFKPNAFGLYDTAGNVWEWTQDCWHGDYHNAPVDGSAWLQADGGNCDRRVVRGGSWIDYPQGLRSAFRLRFSTDDAYINLGFRVVRDF